MQVKTKQLVRVAAVTAAFGLAALTANAAESTFNLPMEAHWGTILLAPGVHHLQVPTPQNGAQCITVTSGRQRKIAMPIVTQPASANHSFLKLVRVNGAYYVDEFQSSSDSRSYTFRTPKSKQSMEAAADGDAATLVAVDSH